MNRKEIREIKQRFQPDGENFAHIYGCYVNAAREIVSEMDLQTITMEAEEKEMYLNFLKKTLSGSLGRNLMNLEFATNQVGESDEHRLLQSLRESHLKNDTMREIFYKRIIDNVDMDGKSYVILLASDSYDVPYKHGGEQEWDEDSTDMFDYFVCAVCQVKDAKAALRYFAENQEFRGSSTGSILSAPQMGFMFPCFDDRMTNIYNVLYYTRSSSEVHPDFIKAIFNVPMTPMAAEQQQNAFNTALTDSLGEDCSLDVVKALHSQIREKVAQIKESKSPETPEMDIDEVSVALMKSGVSAEKVQTFSETCKQYFDDSTTLNPENLIQGKKFELTTPEAKISIEPEFAYSVKTKVIDGREYFLIPVGEDVTINGIEVAVSGSKDVASAGARADEAMTVNVIRDEVAVDDGPSASGIDAIAEMEAAEASAEAYGEAPAAEADFQDASMDDDIIETPF